MPHIDVVEAQIYFASFSFRLHLQTNVGIAGFPDKLKSQGSVVKVVVPKAGINKENQPGTAADCSLLEFGAGLAANVFI